MDVLVTKPVDRANDWGRGSRSNILEIGVRALDTYDDSVILAGLFSLWVLQQRLAPGTVRVWAPDKVWFEKNDPGGFDADEEIVRKRLEHSETIEPIPIEQAIEAPMRKLGLASLAELIRTPEFAGMVRNRFDKRRR